MQKRKFDELISYFNRKVSDMSIDQKYKMELLGMISAIGFAHEKELGTNLASLGTDCISRQQAIDIAKELTITIEGYEMHNQAVMNYRAEIIQLPPIQSKLLQPWEVLVAQAVLPQPKMGKWIDTGGNEEWYAREYSCSECGDTMLGDANFCPNCGAKMEVEHESN